ncbi:hypothetical protein Tco_1359986 [Tanacetum coccineum]
MDSMIPNGRKNTLAEYMILSGADNRPPMLDKPLYDSWKSRMELYMQNIEHRRMILESVEHGLPTDVYALVNHHRIANDIWEQVQLLMQGTSLTKQERECRLLPYEWSKFVTDVKLVRDLHTTNFHHLKAYLEQHEIHVNEVRIMRELNQDPLAHFLVKKGNDPIDAINKMMSFLSNVATSRFPTMNIQLRNSSNQRQQVTIHDGRVTVQPVQRRQNLFAAGTSGTRANILGTGGNNSGQQRVMKYFNCQGEGRMTRQCLKPKRKKEVVQKYQLQQTTSHPNTNQSTSSPVKIEAPRELPKITLDALTEGEWGFEHTKVVTEEEVEWLVLGCEVL